jgi:hypothetical protein
MKTKTNVKAGGLAVNHNETMTWGVPEARGLKVKSRVKAGGTSINHSETLTRDNTR